MNKPHNCTIKQHLRVHLKHLLELKWKNQRRKKNQRKMCFLFHLLQISNFFYWTFYENNHKYKSSQELKRRSQTTLLRHNEHLRDPQTRVGFRGSLSLLCGCQDDEIWAGNFWKLKMCCYKVHVGICFKSWRFI